MTKEELFALAELAGLRTNHLNMLRLNDLVYSRLAKTWYSAQIEGDLPLSKDNEGHLRILEIWFRDGCLLP